VTPVPPLPPTNDLAGLVRELELRASDPWEGLPVHRSDPVGHRNRPIPAIERQLLRHEVRSWWSEHRLDSLSPSEHHRLLDELIRLPPLTMLHAVLVLTQEHLVGELSIDEVDDLVQWACQPPLAGRQLRDALMTTRIADWLVRQGPTSTLQILNRWCRAESPSMVRMGLLGLGAICQVAPFDWPLPKHALLQSCCRCGARTELDVSSGVGWALRALLQRHPELLSDLESRASSLSRRAIRGASEALPADARVRLARSWRRGRSPIGKCDSGILSRESRSRR